MTNSQTGCFAGLLSSWLPNKRQGACACAHLDSTQQATAKRRETKGCAAARPEEEESIEIPTYSPCCDFSFAPREDWWVNSDIPPTYSTADIGSQYIYDPDVLNTVDNTLDALNLELRHLSLKIHSHPEIMFEENYAHDVLTSFMIDHGFHVTKHYLGLRTAWRAEFQHGTGGRVIGVNSEMDALKGLGHACGHNLIAIGGVGVAIALKAALQAQNIPGKVILLGTPAEENGGGKIILLERGGYNEMDACIMCHPGPGQPHSASLGSTIALQTFEVEYYGQSAHAGAAPWDGTNALDAAFLAYSSISVLRQQMKPDHRVHGIVQGKDWSANVIPDYAKMTWIVRAPTTPDLLGFVERVKNCFNAAAMATSCNLKSNASAPYFELVQNTALAQNFADVVGSRYGWLTTDTDSSASTDFGNVSYELPSLHPAFAIPTEPQGGNHTPAFAKAAATKEAHAATIVVMKGLALTGIRLLDDTRFYKEVKQAFEDWKSSRVKSSTQ